MKRAPDAQATDDRAMEYMIIQRETAKELSEAVNAYITQKGWEPMGGVAVCPETERWPAEWSQAMVKR